MNKEFNIFAPVVKSWVEKSEDGNERFIKVPISGLKEDRDGEVIDQMCIDDMILQLKGGTIPLFPNHGRDPVTGERVYRWQDIMGVWVDGEQDGDKLMAVARLNEAHPEAELLWDYMQKGMPVGFSIGGKPTEVIEEEIDGS
tara:strand:- start:1144 stop:1569 length:426 start_codon:yes stop_codon:yes gene_type:complete